MESSHQVGAAALPLGHRRSARHNHGTHHSRHQKGHNEDSTGSNRFQQEQTSSLTEEPLDGSTLGRFQLEQTRIDAVKQDLLHKIGLTRVPDVSRFNVSTEEVRKKLQLYRDSLENVQGNTHTLFDDDQYMAKDFHEVKFSGKIEFLYKVVYLIDCSYKVISLCISI